MVNMRSVWFRWRMKVVGSEFDLDLLWESPWFFLRFAVCLT